MSEDPIDQRHEYYYNFELDSSFEESKHKWWGFAESAKDKLQKVEQASRDINFERWLSKL